MNEQLAKRAVACKGWRWMPGMRTTDGTTVLAIYDDTALVAEPPDADVNDRRAPSCMAFTSDILPDFSDPLTVQAVLLLVREAWDCPEACTGYLNGWQIYPHTSNGIDYDYPPLGMRWTDSYATEVAALVAALEAAP